MSILPEQLETNGAGHLLALGELAQQEVSDWSRDGEHRRDLLSWPCVTARQGAAPQAKAELLTALRRNWSDLGTRYDLAIVSVDTDPRSFDCVQSALALLRDVVAKKVWVIVPREGLYALEPADLGALGFAALQPAEPGSGDSGTCAPAASGDESGTGLPAASGGESLLFYYDVATYKRTPDWLNAKGWAHPQRWGRFRW